MQMSVIFKTVAAFICVNVLIIFRRCLNVYDLLLLYEKKNKSSKGKQKAVRYASLKSMQ